VNALDNHTRVTVFIPTYNRAEWLAGAIESVLAQTWPHFRLIVSDNVSTDGTPEVVARFDDPRLSYVRPDDHLTLTEHFNLCFERSQTEYLFTLPDDDRMAPDLLERTVAVLDQNPRAGIAHAQATVVSRDGAVIAEGHDMTGLSADAVESGEDFICRSMDVSHRVHSSTALIRTEAVSANRMDQRDSPVTDLGHWLRMALSWDMAFIAQPLATCRIHTSAESAAVADVREGGYIKSVDGLLKCHEVKVRFIEEHGERLGDPKSLLMRARRGLRKELLVNAGHATLPDRPLKTTVRALFDLSRLDIRTLFEPAAWRLFAGSILGRRGVSLFKRRLRRPA
jgi:glycosyltransferase involved in cell wall biosynthesis